MSKAIVTLAVVCLLFSAVQCDGFLDRFMKQVEKFEQDSQNVLKQGAATTWINPKVGDVACVFDLDNYMCAVIGDSRWPSPKKLVNSLADLDKWGVSADAKWIAYTGGQAGYFLSLQVDRSAFAQEGFKVNPEYNPDVVIDDNKEQTQKAEGYYFPKLKADGLKESFNCLKNIGSQTETSVTTKTHTKTVLAQGGVTKWVDLGALFVLDPTNSAQYGKSKIRLSVDSAEFM
jgi:hypothetical protein